MSGTGYKLLGFTVWHGGKWYLRRRLTARRLAGALAGLALLGVGALAKRVGG